MSDITMTELLKKTGTRYRLVVMVSQRARDLAANAKPMLEDNGNDKPIAVALRELHNGLIDYSEIKQPKKKKKK